MSKPISVRRLLLASAAATFLFAATAQAGFQWKGPVSALVAAPAGEAPVIDPSPEGMSVMPAERVADVETAPVAPAPVMSAPMAFAPAPVVDGEVVNGFGSDLPLAIALQQIVPPGFQYSFGVGINPGTSVTWEGGKPWKTVLDETLSARGLSYVIDNNVVKIMAKTDSAPAFAAPAAPMMITDMDPAMPDVSGMEIMRSDSAIPRGAGMKPPAEPVTIRRSKPSMLDKMKNFAPPPMYRAAPENIAVPPAPVPAPAEAPAPLDNDAAKSGMTDSSITWSEPPAPGTPMPITREAVMPPAEMISPPMISSPPPPVTSGIGMSADTAGVDNSVPPALANATWHGARGQTLRDVLKNWSDVAGVELYWSIDYDYRLQRDASYPGTYDEAVGKLLDQFATVRPQPYGQLHQQNGNGERVLVIKSYDTVR